MDVAHFFELFSVGRGHVGVNLVLLNAAGHHLFEKLPLFVGQIDRIRFSQILFWQAVVLRCLVRQHVRFETEVFAALLAHKPFGGHVSFKIARVTRSVRAPVFAALALADESILSPPLSPPLDDRQRDCRALHFVPGFLCALVGIFLLFFKSYEVK